MEKRRTLKAAIEELCRERGEKISLKQMVEFYGRAETAEIVAKAVVRTIIETQRKMRAGKFGYSITPKDIITQEFIHSLYGVQVDVQSLYGTTGMPISLKTLRHLNTFRTHPAGTALGKRVSIAFEPKFP